MDQLELSSFLDELSKIASFSKDVAKRLRMLSEKEETARRSKEEIDSRRGPNYTELTQTEEPYPYYPANPVPEEPEIIYR